MRPKTKRCEKYPMGTWLECTYPAGDKYNVRVMSGMVNPIVKRIDPDEADAYQTDENENGILTAWVGYADAYGYAILPRVPMMYVQELTWEFRIPKEGERYITSNWDWAIAYKDNETKAGGDFKDGRRYILINRED